MKKICIRLIGSALLGVGLGMAAGAEEIAPQHLTIKPSIAPGGNVFTNDQGWSGASSINVFSETDLVYKGNINSGLIAQMLPSKDGKRLYTASLYSKRIVYGESEMVLQVFDVHTMALLREIALPQKYAMLTPYRHMLAESADGKYVFVQNATPATSVTVVDVESGRVLGEVPTPGCFGIYPASEASKFSVVCGDGTFATYTLSADGTESQRQLSGKIFDPDHDPIFLTAERWKGDLLFISYHGNVYLVSDSGPAATLKESFSITRGVPGQWGPGGYEIIALNAPNNVLFIGMHPHEEDGSHKTPAKEIWSYDLSGKRILHRSAGYGVRALAVSDSLNPAVFGLIDKTILRFKVDRSKQFALKKTHQHANAGLFNSHVEFRP